MKKNLALILLSTAICFALSACVTITPPASSDTPSKNDTSSVLQDTSQSSTPQNNTPQDNTPQTSSSSAPSKITAEQAKEIALKHAGVAKADAKFKEVEYEYDDGIAYYEIEFNSKGSEYEYDIKASNGDILKAEKDDKNTLKASSATTIKTKDEAKQIAFGHAKVTADKVYDLEIELDDDDGLKVYEIKFKSGGYEYDYELNAQTGKIIKSEKEFDD